MKAASTPQGELFTNLPEPEEKPAPVTKRKVKRLGHVELVRTAREERHQDLGFSAQPFALCNLPARPVKNRSFYERKNGKYFLRIEAGQDKQLPYGQDRLVLILLATMAVQQQHRTVKLGTATDILKMFGLDQSGRNYQRLIESFDRIFSATIFWGLDGGGKFIDKHKISMLDHVRLWYADASHSHGAAFENQVTLGQVFYDHIIEHPIPVDMNVVRCLMDSPAELDFYIWIVLRAWTTRKGTEVRIPLTGPSGLREQLGTQVKDVYKFRQMVKKWLAHAKSFWPECPASLSADSAYLVLSHGQAIHSAQSPVKNLAFPRD